MHRIVPELILENYRAGRYSGAFPAVGMFMDLSGFSTMTDTLMQHGQHGAEVLAGLMRDVFDPLVKSILDYGGKIVSFAGDGVMVLYPITGDEKDAALRALTSAWIIQQGVSADVVRQTIYGRFVFSIKVGLALGNVSWAILRSEDGEQATYYFRGAAVDDSAHAEHRARAGEIILSDGVSQLMRGAIKTQPINASLHRFEGFQTEIPNPIPVVLPPVDLEVSKIFMPEEVVTRGARGEFRQIVNLFMRFPDLPDDQLHSFMRVVFGLRKRYGGLLTRLDFGDKGCNMLLLWGAPVAYENDIGRALNFVLELKETMKFPITAGVTYYIAHAGYLGSELCEDYTCYGWGVNLASRFMMTAPVGEIWVDERVARRLSRRFDFEYVGSQSFKGFAAEQKVHVLRGRKRESENMYRGEMVGREAELKRLKEFVSPLWQGKFTGVLAVTGDAGIGKSRLIREFMLSDLFEERKTLRAICMTDQILRQPFNPLRRWLFRYFDISPRQGLEERRSALNSRLDDLIASVPDPELARELNRTRSILAGLLDIAWADSLFSQLDAEGRYNNTILALITLIKAESLRQPLLMFFEDVQFIDSDSKVFLARLKRALIADDSSYPVSVLISSRPAGIQSFLEEPLIDSFLELDALSTEALASLAEIYLGGTPSPELVELLEARSEGNPYFAEQILVYLQEENLLEISSKGWKATRFLQESSLPADILVLLVARLDQLPRRVRDVVLTAAVIGREFDVQVLAGMLKGRNPPDREVSEAEQADIWVPTQPYRYVFTHGLLRDAAYAMQIQARRMELHASAVAALEQLYPDELAHHYGELAYHAEYSGSREKALYYLRHAARTASNLYQNSQAVDYFTRALAFVPAGDLAAQFDIVAERVELFSRMGNRAMQLKDLESLEQWVIRLDDADRRAMVRMFRSAYHFFIGEYQEAIEYAKLAENCSQSLAESELALYTQVVWATALLHLGRLDEAMQRANKTLENDRRVGNQKEQARILNTMGWIAMEQGLPADARRYLEEALDITHRIKDPGLEARILNHLAKLETDFGGNLTFARDYYRKSYQIAREIGDRYMEDGALSNMAFVAGLQGDFINARAYHEQALAISKEIGDMIQAVFILINLSALSGMQAMAEESLQYAQQARELAQSISEKNGEGWAYLYLGHAYLMLGRYEMAQEAYRTSVSIRDDLEQISLSMEAHAGLVDCFVRVGDLKSAGEEAEKILEFLGRSSNFDGTDEPLRVYFTCYLFLEAVNDPRSRQILQSATRLLERRVSSFTDESERARYIEAAPWRRAIHQLSQKLSG